MLPESFDDADQQLLALVAWKEARGEGSAGMEAVMCVCVNRVGAPGFPSTLHDVIFQKNAFTSISVPSDPEYGLQPDAMDPQWRVAQQLAFAILNGDVPDTTGGACYYANLAHTPEDGWFYRNIVLDSAAHPETVVVGKQTFYR
jgi:N-acetylmuramoyl-L-alanine amidase